MCCECHQVDSIFIYINRDLSNRLRCIRENKNTFLFCQCTDLFHWHYRSYLIISIHDSNKNRSWFDGCFQFFHIDEAIRIYFQISYLATFLFNMLACVKYCLVFDVASDDMIPFACIHFKHTFYSKIVSFSSTRSKNYFFWICSN